jgi:hypothetical protein
MEYKDLQRLETIRNQSCAKWISEKVSDETKKYTAMAIWHDNRWLGVAIDAVYKKWGREGVEVLKKAFFEFGKKEAQRIIQKVNPKEINVRTFLAQLYPNVEPHMRAVGMEIQRIEFNDYFSHSRVMNCPACDAWKDVTDSPWILCEIVSLAHDQGFAKGCGPDFEWVGHPELGGQQGLARGRPYCTMMLELKGPPVKRY